MDNNLPNPNPQIPNVNGFSPNPFPKTPDPQPQTSPQIPINPPIAPQPILEPAPAVKPTIEPIKPVEAFQPIQNPTAPPPPNNPPVNPIVQKTPIQPKKSSHHIKLLLLIIFIVALIFGSNYLISNGTLNPNTLFGPKPMPTKTPIPTKIPSPTPTTDPTAGWQEYSNTKYNYSVKYPTGWTIVQEQKTDLDNTMFSSSGSANVLNDKPALISIYVVATKSLNLDQWLQNHPNSASATTSAGANTAIFIAGTYLEGTPESTENIQLGKNVLNRMASTFRILDQTSSNPQATTSADISNWKTYTDTINSFSYKYPDNKKIEIEKVNPSSNACTNKKNILDFKIYPLDYVKNPQVIDFDGELLISISIENNINKYTTDEFLKQNCIDIFNKISQRYKNGTTDVFYLKNVMAEQKLALINKGNKIIYLNAFALSKKYLDSEFDQILSTFKFTQ